MMPEWLPDAVMSGSQAAARIVCYIARNGEPFTGDDGQQAVTARVSYRQFQQACGFSNRNAVSSGIREAAGAGWLFVRKPARRRALTEYIVPLKLTGTKNVLPAGLPPVPSLCGTNSVPMTGTETEPQNGDGNAVSNVTGTKNVPISGTKNEPLYDDGGRGRNDDDVSRDSINSINHHHHHNGELVRKLNQCGFTDAVSFVARHGPERVAAAVAYIKPLRDVKNPGALIRRTVERPGEIPEPYDREAEMIRQHLKSWGNPRVGRAGGQVAGAAAEPAESEIDYEDDKEGVGGGTTPSATSRAVVAVQ
jgi:hypothetical protein